MRAPGNTVQGPEPFHFEQGVHQLLSLEGLSTEEGMESPFNSKDFSLLPVPQQHASPFPPNRSSKMSRVRQPGTDVSTPTE